MTSSACESDVVPVASGEVDFLLDPLGGGEELSLVELLANELEADGKVVAGQTDRKRHRGKS